jgi:hypothetical protein
LALFRLARFPITDTAEEEEEVVDEREDEDKDEAEEDEDEDEDEDEEDEDGGWCWCFSRDMGGWWGRSAMARHRAFTILRRPPLPTSFSLRKLS